MNSFDNKTLIHAGFEVIAIGGVVFYLHKKISFAQAQFEEQIEELKKRVDSYEQIIKQQNQVISQHEMILRQLTGNGGASSQSKPQVCRTSQPQSRPRRQIPKSTRRRNVRQIKQEDSEGGRGEGGRGEGGRGVRREQKRREEEFKGEEDSEGEKNFEEDFEEEEGEEVDIGDFEEIEGDFEEEDSENVPAEVLDEILGSELSSIYKNRKGECTDGECKIPDRSNKNLELKEKNRRKKEQRSHQKEHGE